MAALLPDHHPAAAGLGTDGRESSKGHGSGLAESMEGGAAQAGHEVADLGGQGLAVQRPQQGGGRGRGEGNLHGVAQGVSQRRPLGAGSDKGGRLRDVAGSVWKVMGHG